MNVLCSADVLVRFAVRSPTRVRVLRQWKDSKRLMGSDLPHGVLILRLPRGRGTRHGQPSTHFDWSAVAGSKARLPLLGTSRQCDDRSSQAFPVSGSLVFYPFLPFLVLGIGDWNFPRSIPQVIRWRCTVYSVCPALLGPVCA